MSPNQYRALEALAWAGSGGLTLSGANTTDTIHRETAAALARRGLAELTASRAYIAAQGLELLAANPREEAVR